jgi:hypothetical protein
MIEPRQQKRLSAESLTTIKKAIEAFEQRFIESFTTQSEAYEIEQGLQNLLNQLGQDVFMSTLSQFDLSADAVEYKGLRYNKAGCHRKKYQSIFGKVEIERSIYRNRSTESYTSLCPFEVQAGIVNGYWTPGAAELASFTMTELASERSTKLINKLTGMSTCSSSLDILLKNVGKVWEDNRQDFDLQLLSDFKIPQDAVSVAVSLDGVLIPTRATRILPSDSRYEEASCGTISFFNEQVEHIKTIQYARSTEHKKATLKRQLKQAMDTVLDERPALKVIKLADGSRDNWTFLEKEIPGDRNVIDFYHASEHLKEGLDAYYGEKSIESSKMHAIYRRKLKNNRTGAKQVLHYLRSLSKQKPKNQKIADQVTYFRRNWKKMAYAKTKKEHLPIGSGIVEAACKTLVTQRLKCSGMHWDYEGAQSILSLRAANQSNWFESAFSLIRRKIKGKVVPLRKIGRENYEVLMRQNEKMAA